MIQPKDLYRKLAILLAEIDQERDKEDYLLSVLARLENSFTRDLHLINGRLYAEEEGQFLPMNADGSICCLKFCSLLRQLSVPINSKRDRL